MNGKPDMPPPGGPFANSKITPTGPESLVADMVWLATREAPISIQEIRRRSFYCSMFSIDSDRMVKRIVEQLRSAHRCPIGASRCHPAGYFWIRTAEDREAAVRPYRDQIFSMWRALRALDSPAALRELHGQLRLEE